MIGQFAKILTQTLKFNRSWGDAGNAIRNRKAHADGMPVVSVDVDKDEFSKRYKMMRITSCIALLCSAGSLLTMPFANSLMNVMFSFVAFVLFLLFYIRYAMILWVARYTWNNWDKRETRRLVKADLYIKAVYQDPSQILPLGLPRAG